MRRVLFLCLCFFLGICEVRHSHARDTEGMQLLEEVLKRLHDDYVSPKTSKELVIQAISSLLKSLDRYSRYLAESDFVDVSMKSKGKFVGIGVEISKNAGNHIEVLDCIGGGPASNAGLQSGDVLISIDGVKVSDQLSIGEVAKLITGELGTKVLLRIKRMNEELEFRVLRDYISLDSVKFNVLEDLLYIRVSSFTENVFGLIESEFDRWVMDQKFPLGMIIDLRGNSGGLFEQALSIADLFLPKGSTVILTKGRKTTAPVVCKAKNAVHPIFQSADYKVPIAVLINEKTASAAEILAVALQENQRGFIVGTRSLGKGSIQTIIPLSARNGALKITTAKYLTPKGHEIEGSGVDPDLTVEYANICGEESALRLTADFEWLSRCDSQMVRAIEFLHGGLAIRDIDKSAQ